LALVWDLVIGACIVKSLLVSETFASLQGESTFAGRPCFFVRLSGCNLRCRYCDTRYAWHGGRQRTIASLIAEYKSSGLPLVEVTGGEPLLQDGVHDLLKGLVKTAQTVLLETNGSIEIAKVPDRVITILDIKCPASGFADSNYWPNIKLLRPHDEVKFVICNRKDYDWAKRILTRHKLPEKCRAVNFSPAQGFLRPPTLAGWIIKDRLPVRLNLQLHSMIWPKSRRRK
jgi:7-carboxy-7-deazaguanine synthase